MLFGRYSVAPRSRQFASLLYWGVVVLACEDSTQLPRYTTAELAVCSECDIQLELVAELGSDSDTIWATAFSGAVRMGDGRFLVTTTDHPGVQAIYSASGDLERTFGTEGQGPGEYMPWTTPYIGPADTVSIIDMLMSRRTVIDADGKPIRNHRVPARFRRAAFLGNRLIAQSDIPSPEKIGFPLHEIDPATGEIVHSFAEVGEYLEPSLDGYRVVSAAGDSGLWVAPPNELVFDLYDRELNRVRTVEPEADWFPFHRNPPAMSFSVPPDPRTLAVWQSADGLLWVLVRVADAEWKPSEPPTVEGPPTVEDSRRDADWVLAVFDPKDGEQLSAVQFDQPMLKGMGDDLVYVLIERPVGGASFAAYKPTYIK